MTSEALPMPVSPTVDEAYAFCRDIAHRYGANFSVGFRFLPRVKRRAVYAAYAWCRWADDIADEPERLAAVGRSIVSTPGSANSMRRTPATHRIRSRSRSPMRCSISRFRRARSSR